MNLNEINFTFAGKHCLRDFGCIYVENGGHDISPQVTRNSYIIAGVSGDIAMPGEQYEKLSFGGTLFFLESPPSQAAAQQALRRIITWLRQGRKPLYFDYEPNRYYLAEVNTPANWSYASWIDGGLSITFDCQPFAYNRFESVAKVKATGMATVPLVVETDIKAPISVDIINEGTAPITAATILARGKQAAFSGLSITTGATFHVGMEPPAGADINGTDAMPSSTRFDHIALPGGITNVVVSLSFGTGTRSATIIARARGRY